MEIFQIITIVLYLVILVVFFLMASNVGRIKEELIQLKTELQKDIRRKHNLNYQTNRVVGDKEAAYRNMVFILMYDLTTKDRTPQALREEYEYFKTKNETKFVELGYPFPEFPF
jgi:hypothetical protein